MSIGAKTNKIDAASFTFIRIISGAIALWIIVNLRKRAQGPAGSWPSALALFGYAAAFSFAYLSLSVGTGALLLFGAVQNKTKTTIGHDYQNEITFCDS